MTNRGPYSLIETKTLLFLWWEVRGKAGAGAGGARSASKQEFDLLVGCPRDGGRRRVIKHARAHAAQQAAPGFVAHDTAQRMHHAAVAALQVALCLQTRFGHVKRSGDHGGQHPRGASGPHVHHGVVFERTLVSLVRVVVLLIPPVRPP